MNFKFNKRFYKIADFWIGLFFIIFYINSVQYLFENGFIKVIFQESKIFYAIDLIFFLAGIYFFIKSLFLNNKQNN